MDVVGREDLLGQLRVAVDGLRAGRGGVVHAFGEAGIGKTTLLARACSWLDDVPFRQAASDPFDATRPCALVGRLVPERPDAEDLVSSTLGCLEQLARSGPLAVLAEDVHWTDRESLAVLAALARRAQDLGILLLTSARPDLGASSYEDVVDRLGTRLALGPLRRDDVATLAGTVLGRPPGPALRALLAETAGNPFLVTELLHALRDRGDLRDTEDDVEPAGPVSLPERLVDRLVPGRPRRHCRADPPRRRTSRHPVRQRRWRRRADHHRPPQLGEFRQGLRDQRPRHGVHRAEDAAADAGRLVDRGDRIDLGRPRHRRAGNLLLVQGRPAPVRPGLAG